MYELPTDPRKIRERIRRYQRKFRSEKAMHGMIGDGAGTRYLLGPLFLLMGDVEGAVESFRWYEGEFPDDSGEPGHHLCWALALHRAGDHEGAERKLRQTMLMNLYLIPALLGDEVDEIDMWHGCSDAEPWYVSEILSELLDLWEEEELDWVRDLYQSKAFHGVRARYIELHKQLKNLPPGPERTKQVTEASSLRG